MSRTTKTTTGGSELESLVNQFRGVFGAATIERYFTESSERLSHSHLPLFARRFASERLAALAQSRGEIRKDVPEVLFVCVHNAGRSQMAAGLLQKMAGGRAHIRTAGSEPSEDINPAVVAAMEEIGVDLSDEFPKPLTDEFVQAADAVITMGCGDACPILPGKRYEDWDLADPEGLPLELVRPIRDEIAERVDHLLTELLDT